MKKLILLILLVGVSAIAQTKDSDKDRYVSLSYGVDARNALLGSKPTGFKSALDYTIDAHIVEENFDFNLGQEVFSAIKFQRKYVALGYHFYVGDVWGTDVKFSIQPSLEWSNITRGRVDNMQDIHRSYSTPSFNINWNWDINKNFAIQLATNMLPRPDLRVIYNQEHNKWITSEGVKLVWKFGHH